MDFSTLNSGGLFVRRSGTISSIFFVEGMMWNIHMKLYKSWTCGSGKDVI